MMLFAYEIGHHLCISVGTSQAPGQTNGGAQARDQAGAQGI